MAERGHSFGATLIEQNQRTLNRYASRLGISQLHEPTAKCMGQWEQKAASLVPARRYRGPLPGTRAVWGRLSLEGRDTLWHIEQPHRAAGSLLWAKLALYWTDGHRTLLQIADRVELELSRPGVELLIRYFPSLSPKPDPEFIVRYFELLEEAGLIELQKTSEPNFEVSCRA